LRRTGKKRVRNSFLIIIVLIIIGILINNTTMFQKINYPIKFKEQVYRFSTESKVDDPYLIFAIIKAESGFDPKATSVKKAKGLMQLMDPTAAEIAKRIGVEDFQSQDLYEPDTNIRIGCWHVKSLMNTFREEKYGEGYKDLIIAAYNGGGKNVKKWLENKEYSSNGKSLDVIPFKETDGFLKKVKRFYKEYKKLYENEI
jgi:soluble lytic murein transglycosylase